MEGNEKLRIYENMLIWQGADDIIDTPLGKANVSVGIHIHNYLTIISVTPIATAINSKSRLVSSGEGTFHKTSTTETFPLEDEITDRYESFKIIGDENLLISDPYFKADYEPH